MGRTPPGQTRDRVFKFMQQHLLGGSPPTVREVQEAFGFRAVQTAREHLESLVAEGRLEKKPGKARGYALPTDKRVRRDGPPVWVPILGRVQAGALTSAVEDRQGYLPIQSRLDPDQLFALRVRGESMRDAGILPEDVVVVHRQPRAENGDIVVAWIDEEATVKRLKVRRGRLELHPANPNFSVMVPPPESLQILGKVVEVRRYFES